MYYESTFVFILVPPAPSAIMATISYYAAQYYTVVVSWEGSKYIAVDFYKLSFNTSEQTFHTNMTSIQLDWPYNTALMLSLSALNCIGSSKEWIKEIFIGKVIVKNHTFLSVLPFLSWVFSSQFPCQWQCQ